MSNTIYPKTFWNVPSWVDHVIHVGFWADFSRAPDFVKCLGNALWKWDREIELHSAPGSIFTRRGLLPWLVIIWSVVWNEVCPSIVVSVTKLVSMLDAVSCVVKWLICCWNVSDVSGFRPVFVLLWWLVVSLVPHVVLAALFIFWQWQLRLFRIGSSCLSLLWWGALFFLNLLLDIIVWTLLQWLERLWLVSGYSL